MPRTIGAAIAAAALSWRSGACGLALLILLCAPLRAAVVDEASVTAAVLYKLMPFITWPADALPAGDLRLCLFDEGALLEALKRYEGKPVLGHSLGIRLVGEYPEAVRDCHVLMVEAGAPGRLARAAAIAGTQPTLVVGAGTGAATRGAMVGVIAEGGRVSFEIDLGALRRARLNASSSLLRLARNIVE